MSIPIHFAPLQGYTDDVYRRIHHELMGGIQTYYTPFLRMEGGGVRSKDMRDIRPEFNEGVTSACSGFGVGLGFPARG